MASSKNPAFGCNDNLKAGAVGPLTKEDYNGLTGVNEALTLHLCIHPEVMIMTN